ncbi:MAG TPA: caspase family protein [Candidatus Dormibacteraeota bacterium]|nr:caspase family protein [Candidatus Dormibacteraeota bacterium]
MANVAILVGNTEYQTLGSLSCCRDDVFAIKELLEATDKFESIELLFNKDSSQLKESIRAAIDAKQPIEEIFFYFTGHGFQHEAEFFFCATNFDSKRPNETGLSNSELHALLRSPEANLVVKVVDACSSGSLLVKSDGLFLPASKLGFKNLIQIASCLDSQNALTGDPLSPFTEKFRAAALRKTDGTVYYTDIIDTLRDEFLDNNNQTPHFVSQGTGREHFVENAKRLDGLRAKLSAQAGNAVPSVNVTSAAQPLPSALDILQRAENKFAKKELAQAFIARLFDKLSEKASSDDSFGQFFSSEVVVHPDFREHTARAFIISILSREKRPDNFVTAEISQEHRRRDPFGLASGLSSAALMLFDRDFAQYDLHLNCELAKAQMRITLTPKFVALKRFVLVVSCAPSLEVCYVMEMLTQHSLQDWGVFDIEGVEVVRRWYKMSWTDSCDGLVGTICGKLSDIVQESVDAAVKAL